METKNLYKIQKLSGPVLYGPNGRPVPISRMRGRVGQQVRSLMFGGYKGANDENLVDWASVPLGIGTIIRNDLKRLRARSRDLARNDDTARRFLNILKQNVLGHSGIVLQAKNKMSNGKPDAKWNREIESEWLLFGKKWRMRGGAVAPSACGTMTLREIAWLAVWNRAIDGECFLQILRGYPHNRHKFAVRFINPDLLDSAFCEKTNGSGGRIEMGIEFDEFDRPIAYHFSVPWKNRGKRIPIPADQIIHLFRNEYVGQVRGIPDFAAIMHKAKMLNGVHEAIVVGWRVAAAKMGFFTVNDPDAIDSDDVDDMGQREAFDAREIEATPGSFDMIPSGYDLKTFDPDYPTSTYESGHKVFMQQLANGLNVSSPTLSNNYSDVNYSSLRQALLEDREGWRCIQAEMIDGFYQPLFDEWYEWTTGTGILNVPSSKRTSIPEIEWQPRGWPWVDPLKEVKAHVEAINARLRTRQSIIAETSGDDFSDTIDQIADEEREISEKGLSPVVRSDFDVQPQVDGEE